MRQLLETRDRLAYVALSFTCLHATCELILNKLIIIKILNRLNSGSQLSSSKETLLGAIFAFQHNPKISMQ